MSDYKSIKDIDSLHSIIEKLYIENNNLIKEKNDLIEENKFLINERKIKNKKYYEENKDKILDRIKINNKSVTKEKKNEYQKSLTYKMENNRLGCINRDKNSTFNMKKIFDHYLKTGQRLQNYQRCSTAVKSRQ